MKKWLSLLLSLLPIAALAQVGGQQSATLSNPFGGNIIASSTNCSVAGACIWQKLPATATTTTITITGTFSATLIVETSADGGNTFTTSSTQTAPAVITITTTSLTDVRVRCSAYTSGSAGVNIQTAGNQLNVTIGSSSGGGGATPNNPALVNYSTDTFNRTAASLGANWTNYLNGFNVTPGAAQGSTLSQNNVAAYTGVTTVPTQASRVSVLAVSGASTWGAALRISGTAHTSVSYYACIESTTAFVMIKVVGATDSTTGTQTTLAGPATVTGANDDSISASIVGNTISCYRNTTSNPLLQTQDTSSPITTGAPGIFLSSNTITASSFVLTNPLAPAGALENVVFDGNSIIAANGNGSNGTDPASSYIYLATTPAYAANIGVSSKCLGTTCNAASSGTIESNLSTLTSVINGTLFVPGIKNVLVIAFPCTNDIASASRTTAQCLTDLTTYVTNAHATGWKVIVVPEISRTGNGVAVDGQIGIMSQLESINSEGADAVVVLPAAMVNIGSAANTILFNADGIHPLEVFHIDILARALIAQLNKF